MYKILFCMTHFVLNFFLIKYVICTYLKYKYYKICTPKEKSAEHAK